MPLYPQAALAIQRAGDLPTDLSPAEPRSAYERQRLTLLPQKPGVAVTLQFAIPSDCCFAGMIRPFFTLGGVVEESAKAEALVAAALGKLV